MSKAKEYENREDPEIKKPYEIIKQDGVIKLKINFINQEEVANGKRIAPKLWKDYFEIKGEEYIKNEFKELMPQIYSEGLVVIGSDDFPLINQEKNEDIKIIPQDKENAYDSFKNHLFKRSVGITDGYGSSRYYKKPINDAMKEYKKGVNSNKNQNNDEKQKEDFPSPKPKLQNKLQKLNNAKEDVVVQGQ